VAMFRNGLASLLAADGHAAQRLRLVGLELAFQGSANPANLDYDVFMFSRRFSSAMAASIRAVQARSLLRTGEIFDIAYNVASRSRAGSLLSQARISGVRGVHRGDVGARQRHRKSPMDCRE
jgi:hypothetical protein